MQVPEDSGFWQPWLSCLLLSIFPEYVTHHPFPVSRLLQGQGPCLDVLLALREVPNHIRGPLWSPPLHASVFSRKLPSLFPALV